MWCERTILPPARTTSSFVPRGALPATCPKEISYGGRASVGGGSGGGGGAPIRAGELEAVRVVERADESEPQGVVGDEVLRDALHVVRGDRAEPESTSLGSVGVLEHLAEQAEAVHALRRSSESTKRPFVYERAFELDRRHGLLGDLLQLGDDRRDRPRRSA